jgi:hypothetical protein
MSVRLRQCCTSTIANQMRRKDVIARSAGTDLIMIGDNSNAKSDA